ncbi:hypothetical protein IWQ60_003592 [Tieghemiomyces parasiticus]|uniref:Uncharacterized protein n=1 Tax=Tieghemiomyces parasiticus TaxID=78921 RepID=A0A9W8DZX2_9FUNG|nr:hypothetical protein IWQ60_003592 [Tieghemiomyces parasiticus]
MESLYVIGGAKKEAKYVGDTALDIDDSSNASLLPPSASTPVIRYLVTQLKLISCTQNVGPTADETHYRICRPALFKPVQLEVATVPIKAEDGTATDRVLWRQRPKCFTFGLHFESPVYGREVILDCGRMFSLQLYTFDYDGQLYAWRWVSLWTWQLECVRMNDSCNAGARVALLQRKWIFSLVRAVIDLHPDETWSPGFQELLLFTAMRVVETYEARKQNCG